MNTFEGMHQLVHPLPFANLRSITWPCSNAQLFSASRGCWLLHWSQESFAFIVSPRLGQQFEDRRKYHRKNTLEGKKLLKLVTPAVPMRQMFCRGWVNLFLFEIGRKRPLPALRQFQQLTRRTGGCLVTSKASLSSPCIEPPKPNSNWSNSLRWKSRHLNSIPKS